MKIHSSYLITGDGPFLSKDDIGHFPNASGHNAFRLDNTGNLDYTRSTAFFEYLAFRTAYVHLHGPIALTICIFGATTNLLNISVFTRPHMRTPTSLLLTFLAVVDLLLMSTYGYYAYYGYINNMAQNNHMPNYLAHAQNFSSAALGRNSSTASYTLERSDDEEAPCVMIQSYWQALCVLCYAQLSITLYGISTWLTIGLAGLRWHIVRSVQHNIHERHKAHCILLAVFCLVPIWLLPNYATSAVRLIHIPSNHSTHCNLTVSHKVGPSDWSIRHDNAPLRIAFWTNAVLFRMLPCAMLSVFVICLLGSLQEIKKRRRRMRINSTDSYNDPSSATNPTGTKPQVRSLSCKHVNKITLMLMSVLILFLVTQLPQGIVTFLVAIEGESFRTKVYNNLAEIWDLLSLVNSSFNFPLYCITNSSFSDTFKIMYFGPLRRAFSQRYSGYSAVHLPMNYIVKCRSCGESHTVHHNLERQPSVEEDVHQVDQTTIFN